MISIKKIVKHFEKIVFLHKIYVFTYFSFPDTICTYINKEYTLEHSFKETQNLWKPIFYISLNQIFITQFFKFL